MLLLRCFTLPIFRPLLCLQSGMRFFKLLLLPMIFLPELATCTAITVNSAPGVSVYPDSPTHIQLIRTCFWHVVTCDLYALTGKSVSELSDLNLSDRRSLITNWKKMFANNKVGKIFVQFATLFADGVWCDVGIWMRCNHQTGAMVPLSVHMVHEYFTWIYRRQIMGLPEDLLSMLLATLLQGWEGLFLPDEDLSGPLKLLAMLLVLLDCACKTAKTVHPYALRARENMQVSVATNLCIKVCAMRHECR